MFGVQQCKPTYSCEMTCPLACHADTMSGYTIYKNNFTDVQTGIMLGGGRRNHIKFNHFERCTTAIEFDDRGVSMCEKAKCATFAPDGPAIPPDGTDWPTVFNALADPCRAGGSAQPLPCRSNPSML